MALKIGIAGPVGSGKTSLIESLTNMLKDKYSLGIVTNDIYTTEDANYLKQHLDLDENRIIGVETGGCPHTAIRDDISMNQRAVIELEEKFNPDIVFVDIMMPRLDGYQTCALIKNSQNYQNIPVVMLSSKDGLFDQAKGRVVGSDEYLTKPFSKDELLNAIRNHVTV